ncbi:MAG: SpoIIE family protein phosphatase [Pseudomonadota bacterium]
MTDHAASMDFQIDDIVSLIEESSLFVGLDRAFLSRIAKDCPVVTAAADAVLMEQGELGDFAYLVLRGTVSISVATDLGSVIVATVGPGEIVGEIAAFASTPRTASVIAREPVTLLRIEQSVIGAMLAEAPQAAMAIIADLGVRLQGLNGSIAALTQATRALAEGAFEPSMLDAVKNSATRFKQFAETFEQMADEIANKRLLWQEMQFAADIQQSFLPKDIDGGALKDRFSVSAFMRPAKDVGGDFYDYFMIDDEWLAIAIGDVSGKGVPAAIFMSVSRMVLKSIAREGLSAAETLSRVNDILAEDNPEGMFVTVGFARLHLLTGALNLCTGGHEEALIVTAGGGVEKPGPRGPALGLFEGAAFSDVTIKLDPGARVVLGTDGITEAFAPSGTMYGWDRLETLVLGTRLKAPQALVSQIVADVDAFADGRPQSDDLTCLALAYHGARDAN